MDWGLVFGATTAFASAVAAGAALWSARSAEDAAKASAAAAATAKRDLEERDLPHIVAHFCQVPKSFGVDSDLGIKLANYGGVATNVRLSAPQLSTGTIETGGPTTHPDPQYSVLHDIASVAAFMNGIDVFAPGESIIFPVGRYDEGRLSDLHSMMLLAESGVGPDRSPARFEMKISYDVPSGRTLSTTAAMTLDKTIVHRHRSQR